MKLPRKYTSRSAIETYSHCQEKRRLQYFYGGRGIVPAGSNIYLTTGSAIHKGVEFLGTKIQTGTKINWKLLEEAAEVAEAEYVRLVDPQYLTSHKVETAEARQFAYREQKALVQALVVVWGLVEGKRIAERFRVVGVELDSATKLTTVYPGDEDSRDFRKPWEIWLETKADMLLEDKVDGSLYVYSLKSCKTYNSLLEKSYSHDLQGITESWGAEKWIRRQNKKAIKSGLPKKYQDRIQAVRFCYLVKGQDKEKTDYDGLGTGVWFTYNPFVRGYRNVSAKAGGTQFAHSWFYSKPENKSGKGTLGKGWQPFQVYEEYNGGVIKWMQDIREGEIQPNYSLDGEFITIFQEHCVVPEDIHRLSTESEKTMEEVRKQEEEAFRILGNGSTPGRRNLNRHGCFWPTECEYTPFCFGDTHKGGAMDAEEAIEGGWFKWREPHHERERRQQEENG